jgi:hypothetical protein
MWLKHLKSLLAIGATRERVLAGAVSSLQEALRLAHQLQAVVADQTAMIHRYDKLIAELSAPKSEHADAGPDRRLNCEKAMAFRCRDANIQQGRDNHWN